MSDTVPPGLDRVIEPGLAETFTEVPDLPGRNLVAVVDGGQADDTRSVYLMTRDNMLEDDTGASGLARRLKRTVNPPVPLCIRMPAHTASNFEGLVVRVDDAPRGAGHLWSWCAPLTIRPPGSNFTSRRTASAARRIAPARSTTSGNSATSPPTRSKPTTGGPTPACTSCATHMQLKEAHATSVPERHQPWPYAVRRPPTAERSQMRSAATRFVRRLFG